MLYLLKASRIAEYHQQNVAILGADEHVKFTVRYGHRWVQPDLSVAVGDGCVIVFSDSPYQEFVPVRFAKVTRFESLPDLVEIEVSLGPWVHADDRAVLTRAWSGRSDPQRPGSQFLFSDENPGLRSPSSPDELEAAWRAAVNGLSGNQFYARSVIARLRQLVLDDGTPIDDETPVHAGDTIRAVVDLVSPTITDESVRAVADFQPAGAAEIRADSVVHVPGRSEIPIRLLAPGESRIRVRFLPDPLLSSRPAFTLTARVPEDATAAPAIGDGAAPRLARLVARLERDARLTDSLWIGLYEDVLLDWAPRDTVLTERYAGHLVTAGDFAKAARVLRALTDRSTDGDHMLLIASIRAGEPFDAAELLPRIDLTADGPFGELLQALDSAHGAVWQQVLDLLPHRLLGDDKSHSLLLAARDHVRDAEYSYLIAEGLALQDREAASNFLLRQWTDPESTPPKVVELLLELDANRAHLLPYVDALLAELGGNERWNELENVLARARKELRDHDRYLATARGARQMIRSTVRDVADRGFELTLEASHEACALGDLDTALRAATIARAYALRRKDSDLEGFSKELVDSIETAILQTEVFRQYKEAGQDQKARRRGEWLRGKRLHVVGGQEPEWSDAIRVECGLAEIRWHASEKHKAPPLDWANSLDPSRDVVVCVTSHIGHSTSGPLKDICTKRNVAYVPAELGKQSVLAALADAAPDPQDA